MSEPWAVLTVVRGREADALAHLRLVSTHTFLLPMALRPRKRGGPGEGVAMPGYIFVRPTDIYDLWSWKNAGGLVSGFLMAVGPQAGPALVPDDRMQAFLQAIDEWNSTLMPAVVEQHIHKQRVKAKSRRRGQQPRPKPAPPGPSSMAAPLRELLTQAPGATIQVFLFGRLIDARLSKPRSIQVAVAGSAELSSSDR